LDRADEEPAFTELVYLWRAASSVGAWAMTMDPEELVTLTDHGTMKLRAAVVRAMILSAKERKRATIVREGEPAILNFKEIRNLGAKWDERRESSARGNRFHKRQRQQRRIRSRGNGRKSRAR
jgi:site-specific recombinase XerC